MTKQCSHSQPNTIYRQMFATDSILLNKVLTSSEEFMKDKMRRFFKNRDLID